MKVKFYSKLLVFVFITILVHSQLFSNSPVQEIFANQNFTITHQQDYTSITMDKKTWESFTISVNQNDIQHNPVINLDLMTSDEVEHRVDITDGRFISNETTIIGKKIDALNSFKLVSFDFTTMLDYIDLSNDVYLIFFVNPGKNYKGEMNIRDFFLSDLPAADNTSNEDLPGGFNMYPSPATTFTNIEIPAVDFTGINGFDRKGRVVKTENVYPENETTVTLQLDDLNNGYYTVQLKGASIILTEKLIIN